MTEQDQLTTIIKEIGIEQTQVQPLINKFGVFYTDAIKLTARSKGITIKDVSQIEEMKKSREYRLRLKKIRTDANKIRVEMKEPFLRGANAVQAAFNGIEKITKKEEKRLEDQEKFIERIEAERKNEIEVERVKKLFKYVEEAESYSLHPDKMSDDVFNKLLENSKVAFEVKKRAEAEAEKERLVQIELEKKEQERIRLENTKLRAEAETKEKELAKERAEQEKKMAIERKKQLNLESKLRAEKELKAQKERKERELIEANKKAEEELRQKAMLAPDKEKLLKLANEFELINFPAVESKKAKDLLDKVEGLNIKIIKFTREGSKSL